ncbi:putative F-box protein [Cardamine amara subsp. amara]|uniref:F-box protein n=1 Tax=Cardamine amara subsp. amara TaxID=228776 RepID=A0ABD1AVM9_CARAN
MRKLQQEREKKRLEAEEEKRKAKDLLITNSSNSVRQYSDSIPADILIDIFLRVPAKSIGRFRCVSKFWKSILGRPDFTELFLTKSVARTGIFFAVEDKDEEDLLLVFSSPQPLNPNNNSCLVATHYKSFPKHFPNGVLEICNSLCGFVFLQSLSGKQRVICNPVTGECITLRSLPNVTSNRIMGNYLGFDPINKQFKVLCMTWSRNGTPNTHWVLTLGTGKRIWRTIQYPFVFHYSRCRICINGVLYYISTHLLFFMNNY